MKKLLFLGACLVILALPPAMAQTGGPNVIVVRVFDSGTNVHLAISRGEGKTEMVAFS